MNPMNPTFDLKAFGESLQAGREAWQGGMKLWSETLPHRHAQVPCS